MLIETKAKPAHGQPCNNCGLCCLAEQCPVSAMLFGLHDLCPAIGHVAGEAGIKCGLVAAPKQFLDFVPGEKLDAELASRGLAALMGVGVGCDARFNGEPEDKAFAKSGENKYPTETKRVLRKFVMDVLVHRVKPEYCK
jgi:hypothetical protein